MRHRSLALLIALTLVAIPGNAAALGTLDQEARMPTFGAG